MMLKKMIVIKLAVRTLNGHDMYATQYCSCYIHVIHITISWTMETTDIPKKIHSNLINC